MKAKKITFVIALVFALTITSMTVFGQDNADQQLSRSRNESGNKIEGVWQNEVTVRDCQSGTPFFTFKSLTTFMQGGTMLEDAAFESPFRTSGHGIWQKTHGRQYIAAWTFFAFAPDGSFIGSRKVSATINLNSANSTTSDATVEIYDANGNLLVRGCSSATSTRFTF